VQITSITVMFIDVICHLYVKELQSVLACRAAIASYLVSPYDSVSWTTV